MTQKINKYKNKCDNCQAVFYIESWTGYSKETYHKLNNINFCSEKCNLDFEQKLQE